MISQNALMVYEFAASRVRWDAEEASIELNLPVVEVIAAREELVALHLLSVRSAEDELFTVRPPDVAAATLLDEDVRRLHHLQTETASRRGELLGLMPLYREVRAASSASEYVELIEDGATVTRYLTEFSRNLSREALFMHPEPISSVESARSGVERDRELLARGVSRRSIRHDRDRDHPPTVMVARETSPLGGEVRTLPAIPLRIMIFDRVSALVSRADYNRDTAALVVRSPELVESMAAVFDAAWDVARPLIEVEGEASSRGNGGLNAVQHAILDGMIRGLSDEAIASRLQVSVRTCRRHVALIFEYLGAESRFQAGALAAASGLLRPAQLRSVAGHGHLDSLRDPARSRP